MTAAPTLQVRPTIAELADRLRTAPTLATAQAVIDATERDQTGAPRPVVRVAVLRSFTIEPVIPFLRAGAALEHVDARLQLSDFNAYAQEILDPGSRLYAFQPHLVVIAIQTRDLLPGVWSRWSADPAAASSEAEGSVATLTSLVGTLRERTSARIVIQGFEQPAFAAAGILDAQGGPSQRAVIDSANDSLRRLAASLTAVDFLDYDALIARHGRVRWHDQAKFLIARMPIAAECLPSYAEELLRFVLPAAARTRKVLVTDLDNTLWGGIVGEAGAKGVVLDDEYPGAAYRELQRAMMDLHARGVVLAIASRNNSADAMEVLERHPGMLLRPEDFAALRINWNDKAGSMREIAAELNLGLDTFVFIDDSPRERERIRQDLPEVYVVPLGDDPLGYADALRRVPSFERVAISEEDRGRGRLYADERRRIELRHSAASLEDFYRSLGMVVAIVPMTQAAIARVAQLTQKTNQFNLTTRRYNEQEIADLVADPCWRVVALRAEDRYGDSGIVGVGLLRLDRSSVAEIDTFLLSCRVIGRTVETALLALLAELAQAAGARSLRGWYKPTSKNAPAASFYADHGFTKVAANGSELLWEIDLVDGAPRVPEWIRVTRG